MHTVLLEFMTPSSFILVNIILTYLVTSDVGFPSGCYKYVLLPFVNKEAVLADGRAEYMQSGRIQRESRRNQGDVI